MTLRRISLNEKSGFPAIKTVLMRSRIIVGAITLLIILIITLNYWETSSQNNNLARQVDNLEESLKLSAAKQEELEEELGLSKNSYDQCKRDQKEVSVELDTCKKEAVDRESQISRLKTEISQMETTVTNLQKKESELEGSIKKQADQIQELERQLQSKAAALSAAEAQLKQAETLKESLNMDVRNLQERIKSFENQQLPDNNNGPDSSKPNVDHVWGNHPGHRGVHIIPKSFKGIISHGIPVLWRDPPGKAKAKPRFSVAGGVQNASPAIAQADSVPNRYQMVEGESAAKEEAKSREAFGRDQPVEGQNLNDFSVLAEPKLEAPPKPNVINSEPANAGDGQAVLKLPQLSNAGHRDADKNEAVNGLLSDQLLAEPKQANLQENVEDDQGLALKDGMSNNDGGDTNNEINVDVGPVVEELPGNDKAAAAAKHLEEEGGEDENELLEEEKEPGLG